MNTDYLINLLDSNLQSKLETIKRAASRIWETQKMQHFTKHGISHSENIIGILKLTLEDMRTMKDKLSKHEIFILLASAYLHDIGMQSAYHAGLPDKSSYDIDDKKIIRDRHHETSSKMILKSVDETVKRRVDCGLADCIQPNYVRYIALLSKSHRIGKPGILSNLLDEDYLKTGEKIRVRLLTALLRFADELDRDYLRVNMEELKLWDIPTDSKVYWWMHHYTKAVEIENGRIRILFRIPVNYKDSHMKVDEIIFMETLDCINNQFMEVKNVLWNSKIYLDFDEKPPKEDDGNYTDDSSVFPIPEDVINFINTKFKVQKSAEELTKRTGVVYWVNGIPKSDDETLKKLMDGALTHAEKEEYIQSIEKIESALILTVGPSERMALKLTLGNCYRVIGKNNEAIKNYKDVIAVSDVLDTIDAKSGGIAAYGNLGHIYSIQGDLNKSLEYHFHVFNIYKEIEDLQNQAAALGNIGLIYFDKGDLDNALKYLKDGLKIDQEIGCKQGEANQLGNIGLIYSDKGGLDNALEYHQDALKIDQEIGYKEGEANQLGNIGLIYSDKGDLDKALKYVKDALKIHRKIGYKQGEANQLGNIGLIYSDKSDLDNALKYLKDALKIHRKIGYKQGEASQLGNIGLIYSDKGDLDNALKYLKDALKIHRKIGYKKGEVNQLGNIGLIYRAKGDLDNALKYLKDALNILDRFNLIYGRDIIQNAINLIAKKQNKN